VPTNWLTKHPFVPLPVMNTDDRAPVITPDTTTDQTSDASMPAGWDPYEVWYTRVYLPRLESERLPPKRTPLDASTELRTLEVDALLAGPSTR
jgi:hypothetical protein